MDQLSVDLIDGKHTINYSSIEDKELYEKMELSTQNYYSSEDINLNEIIDKLNKCLIEQGLTIPIS